MENYRRCSACLPHPNSDESPRHGEHNFPGSRKQARIILYLAFHVRLSCSSRIQRGISNFRKSEQVITAPLPESGDGAIPFFSPGPRRADFGGRMVPGSGMDHVVAESTPAKPPYCAPKSLTESHRRMANLGVFKFGNIRMPYKFCYLKNSKVTWRVEGLNCGTDMSQPDICRVDDCERIQHYLTKYSFVLKF